MATVNFAGQKVNIDPLKIADFMKREPNVLKGMLLVGDRVKTLTVESMTGFPRTFLGPRIVKRVNMANDGPHVLVGSDKTKTRPHPIDGNPVLVFPVRGVTVFARHVNHPGSDFTRYLLGRLRGALRLVRI